MVDNYGDTVEPNPVGTPTKDLTRVKINNTIYRVPEKGDPGNDGHNPNLGTYLDTEVLTEAPTTGILPGDFIVVVHTDVTPRTSTMYTWNGSAWTDTLRDAGAAFATGEYVSVTKIVNNTTDGGEHDVLSAEQGKELNQQLSQLDQN